MRSLIQRFFFAMLILEKLIKSDKRYGEGFGESLKLTGHFIFRVHNT